MPTFLVVLSIISLRFLLLYCCCIMAEINVDDQLALLQSDEEAVAIFAKLEGADKAKLLELIKTSMTPVKEELAPGGQVVQPDGAVGSVTTTLSNIPKLGTFSGDEPIGKGEIPYEQWKQEVNCLTRENYSENVVMLSIRRSLKTTASSVLVNLGTDVTTKCVIEKFDIVFGNVLPSEMLLESFYTARQNENESVVAWGCRLESLLNKAKQQGTIEDTEDMARTKFWSGVRDERVKGALRHKFDSGENFQELLRNGRMLEHEFNTKSASVKVKAHSAEVPSELKAVLDRMEKLEKNMSKLLSKESTTSKNESPPLFCKYCKRTNHTIENCRILARKNAKESGNSAQSTPGTGE